jgi:glutathione S-transferase
MKLYYSKGACSLSIRIIINEIGLECDYESVDLRTKKTESGDDYFKINPKGSVPALMTDDGKILTEGIALHVYLAETNNAYDLLPQANDFNRYRVLEWLNYVSTEVHKSFAPFFHPMVTQEVKQTIFSPIIKTKLNFLDQALSQKTFLLGDQFTLPDAYLYVVLSWAKVCQIDIAQWPNIAAFCTQVQKRKSVQQSLKEEHLELAL